MERSLAAFRLLKNCLERRVRARGLQDFFGYQASCRPGALTGRAFKRAAMGVLGMLIMVFGFQTARGQSYTAYDVKPTVTTNMGELGGKYFGQTPDPAKTHHYYIAAEPDEWDYMPIGSDPVCGMTPSADVNARHLIRKALFPIHRRYLHPARAAAAAVGHFGPGVAGRGRRLPRDHVFEPHRAAALHLHGVKYDKDSEGSYYGDKPRFKIASVKK